MRDGYLSRVAVRRCAMLADQEHPFSLRRRNLPLERFPTANRLRVVVIASVRLSATTHCLPRCLVPSSDRCILPRASCPKACGNAFGPCFELVDDKAGRIHCDGWKDVRAAGRLGVASLGEPFRSPTLRRLPGGAEGIQPLTSAV
jgi:hypothetical protein